MKDKKSMQDTELVIEKELRQRKVRKVIIRMINILVVFIIIAFVVLFFKLEVFKIQKITINDNYFVSDEEILEKLDIKEGDNYYLALLMELDQRVEKIDAISDVTVVYDNNTISLTIEEEDVLFKFGKKFYFTAGYILESDSNYPAMDFANYSDSLDKETILSEFEKLRIDDEEVFNHISQVRFDPSPIDKDRLKFVMKDGNTVFILPDQISEKMKYYFTVVDGIYTKFGTESRGVINFASGSDYRPY